MQKTIEGYADLLSTTPSGRKMILCSLWAWVLGIAWLMGAAVAHIILAYGI